MNYRLGLDIGATSIGWCVLPLANGQPAGISDVGVRIFTDGRDAQSSEPLAVARRMARGMRRNRDRRILRQKDLADFLLRTGILPRDTTAQKSLLRLDPYALRQQGLDQQLPLHHLGRALFHLGQRRGFKSNRKAGTEEKEGGAIRKASDRLSGIMRQDQARTLGEWLAMRHARGETVRVRPEPDPEKKSQIAYDFYPTRSHTEAELTALWQAQRDFHPTVLTIEWFEELQNIILYQRPLRPQKVGCCQLEHESREPRAPKASLAFQRFRYLCELNILQAYDGETGEVRVLVPEQRQILAVELEQKGKLSFDRIRRLLKLGAGVTFNLEDDKRSEISGNHTVKVLADKKRFGPRWFALSDAEQREVIRRLLESENEAELVTWLQTEFHLPEDQAEAAANAPLEEGYGRLSLKALNRILPFLEQGEIYSRACELAGYHHSDHRPDTIRSSLPYYGEALQKHIIPGSFDPADRDIPEKYYGKINNPTVHIGLNQLQKLINALIAAYGPPTEIVVELARDLKLSQKEKKALDSENAKNKKRNDWISKELKDKLGIVNPSGDDLRLYKLWEESGPGEHKSCVFCGQQMPLHQVFGQEGLFEIEHLLPFSRSFNDNMNNKVLSCRACNRRKAEHSPFEAFGATPEWPEIWQRAQCLAGKKAWRFQPDAWEQSKGRGEDVIARLLNDTKYLSRMAREYLAHICPDNRIWVIPGQMTAMLRGKWGLNGWLGDPDNVKERKDHRHHAIDAFVVACTDRATLQRISRAAEHRAHRARLIEDMPPPFPGFDYAAGKQLFRRIVVSHKPDHGGAFRAVNPPAGRKPYTVGRLHEETAYGLAKDEGGDKLTLVKREALSSFEKIKDLEAVRDACWRKKLLEHMQAVPCDEKGKPLDKTAWAAALSDFAIRHRVRRLRVLVEKTRETVIGIRQPQVRNDPQTEPFKYYATGSNYCADIYCPDKGPLAGKWQIEVISTFRAHQKNFIPEWKRRHPTARLVMRLHNNDMVALTLSEAAIKNFKLSDQFKAGNRICCRIKKMSGNIVFLIPHFIAFDTLERTENGQKKKIQNYHTWAANPEQLQERSTCKISVDILGRIKDPVVMQAQAT